MLVHTLDQLTDATLPGCAPQEPVSTWAFDVVGHIEATGIYAETLEHNRDLAAGFLDPAQGYLTWDEKKDERSDADALSIARQGGERVYDQEQGFAPLILLPGLRRDGSPNADALACAWLDEQSPATSIDVPELSQSRRHWRDIGPEEQNAKLTVHDAESELPRQDDPLGWLVNQQLGGEDGVPLSYGTDSVDWQQLVDDAPDLAEHYERMLDQQAERLLREFRHAREQERKHLLDTHGHPVRCRRTAKAAPTWRERTRPWREQAQARKAALAARGWDGEVRFRPLTAATGSQVERERVAWRECRAVDLSPTVLHGPARDVLRQLAHSERLIAAMGERERPAPHVPVPPPASDVIYDDRWLRVHGHRILLAVADEAPTIEPGTDAWWDLAEATYDRLKAAQTAAA